MVSKTDNPCGLKETVTEQTTDKASRAPRKKFYQPKRTTAYLAESGVEVPMGRWSDMETLTLIVLSNLLKRTGLPANVSNLEKQGKISSFSNNIWKKTLFFRHFISFYSF